MSPAAAKSRVLIVDDNEQNLELLQAYLEELEDIETCTAMNGLQALAEVAAQRPDLILLDVMMPKMSGFEVCRHLKGEATTRDIPVLIITALNESSDYERGMESGADGFLTRPLDRMEFLEKVRGLLRVRKLRGGLPRGSARQDPTQADSR